jgi:hypothetical protein
MENINRNYVNGVLKSLGLVLNHDGTIEWGSLQSPSPINLLRKLISKLPPLMHNVFAKTLFVFQRSLSASLHILPGDSFLSGF